MRRRLPQQLIVSILLLLLAVNLLLWIRGYTRAYDLGFHFESWPRAEVWKSRYVGARLVQGRWLIQWGSNEFNLDQLATQGWGPAEVRDFHQKHSAGLHCKLSNIDVVVVATNLPEVALHLPPGVTLGPADYLLGMRGSFDAMHDYQSTPSRTDRRSYAMFPAWLSLMVLLVVPLWSLSNSLRRRRRRAKGYCAQCGYDLRASPGRCPECGASTGVSAEKQPLLT